MILLAVFMGYLLGIAPFLCKEIQTIIQKEKENQTAKKEQNDATQILDEWLNGKQEVNNKANQEDIYQEYMTGVVKKGE